MLRAVALALLMIAHVACSPTPPANSVARAVTLEDAALSERFVTGPLVREAHYAYLLRSLVGPQNDLLATQFVITVVSPDFVDVYGAEREAEALPFTYISRDTGFCTRDEVRTRPGCAVAEDVALTLTEGDLLEAAASGFDVSLLTKSGPVSITLPQSYAQGFLTGRARVLAPLNP